MRIAFVHPDLGIGGAERLIVDAAVALQRHGHDVTIYTSHHDPGHCFPETKKQLRVIVAGDWLPRSIFGSFYLLCAAIRAIYLAAYVVFNSSANSRIDVIIADQITFHLPLLRLSAFSRILFYCHFPDKFLSPKGGGMMRRLAYRQLLDWGEEWCLARGADEIVVNSEFTRSKFFEAFSSSMSNAKPPSILYPGVACSDDAKMVETLGFDETKVFLSLNRFERKKDLHLAIKAFSQLALASPVRLIIAGGYDHRVRENAEHLKELEDLCDELKVSRGTFFQKDYLETGLSSKTILESQVTFLPSISQATKEQLLNSCHGLLYTPSFEHFGIVPVEAMSFGLPVIAMNSGGPKETVDHGSTGWLCEPTAESLAEAMKKICLMDPEGTEKMARFGKLRAKSLFSARVFGEKLNEIVNKMVHEPKNK